MWRGVEAKRSNRDPILWGFHTIVDQASDKAAFVGEVLRRFNVPPDKAMELGPRIVAQLPRELRETEMADVLAVFERVIPIHWTSDLVVVPREVAAEIRRAIRTTLEGADKTVTPRQLSARLQPELVRLLGAYVAPNVLETLPDRCNATLVSSLWRIHGDKEALADLVDWLLHDLQQAGIALGET